MKLLDKMILLSRFLLGNIEKTPKFEKLSSFIEYFEDQRKYFGKKDYHNDIIQTLNQIDDLYATYKQQLKQLDSFTTDLLTKEEKNILQRDYINYETIPIAYQDILDRQSYMHEDFTSAIVSKIGFYSDWRYAVLDCNPANGKFIRSVIGNDPLYILEHACMDKDAIKSQFNGFFADRRLFWHKDIKDVPKHIGLCININEFEYLPIDPIKSNLQSVYNTLLPGGHFIFTYNNCENIASLDLTAESIRCYNTKTLMQSLAYSIGYDIIESQDFRNGAHSLMIIKKPGELDSQKLGAPLVSIDSIPIKAPVADR